MKTDIEIVDEGQLELTDYEGLTPKQKTAIQNNAVVSIWIDEAKAEKKADAVDLEKLKSTWLASKSKNTQAMYLRTLAAFESYCEGRGIKPLLAKAQDIDGWIDTMRAGGLANNSIRAKVSSISALFSTLRRYGVTQNNPCYGAPLPKKEYKNARAENSVMSDAELKIIEGYFGKRKKQSILSQAIHFMATYGLRVGALPSIKIDRAAGVFSYETKGGKKGRRKLIQATLERFALKAYPFSKSSRVGLSVSVHRLMAKLYKARLISRAYSAHDFRHFFAANHYKQNKDIVKLKSLLDHASISITDIYLQGLQEGL